MHLGKHVLEDFDVSSLDVGTQTPWGKRHFQKGLQAPTSSLSELRRRQIPILLFRSKQVRSHRDQIHEALQKSIVPNIEMLEDAANPTSDPRVHEGVGQIFWSKDSFFGKHLNTQHLLLTFLLVWKTLLLPGLSVVAPILAVIVPFLLLRCVHGDTSLTMWEYGCHVKRTLLQQINIPSVLRAKHDGDILGKVLETLFLGLTCFTFVSSLWNQIQSALHLRSIAADVCRRGEVISETVHCARTILATLHSVPSRTRYGLRHFLTEGERILAPFDVCKTDRNRPLTTYGFVWNNPSVLEDLLKWIGQLDVWIALSRLEGVCTPRFIPPNTQPTHQPTHQHPLRIEGLYHPSIDPTKRVPNTVHLTASPSTHVLLTGPNRGGKSTFCKALGLSILLAQTWGFAWARRMSYTPFTAMITALRPTDALGKMSLFESEIEFARDVLAVCDVNRPHGPVFVMMDEIFHSTNAHDGFEATRVFLQKLYAHGPHVTSVISTHYRGLTDVFQKTAVLWAMEAYESDKEDKHGQLQYTYRVIPGVSDKSSVMEILQERGLA